MAKSIMTIISKQILLRQGLALLLSESGKFDRVNHYDEVPVGLVTNHSFNQLNEEEAGLVIQHWFLVDIEISLKDIEEVFELRKGPDKVFLFSGGCNLEKLVEAMPLRADGYITTELSTSDLYKLFEKAENGEPVISQSLVPHMLSRITEPQGKEARIKSSLTSRETEILKLIIQGYTNQQIARKLVISIYTVKNHVHNILEKLGVPNRARLVAHAINNGLAG